MSRRQWQIAQRRFLLVAGDTIAVLAAVLIAFAVWVIVDRRESGLSFIVRRSYWFPILAALWLALASANDFYTLRVASRTDSALARLVQITLQSWIVYLVIFFFSPRDALPRLFILYYGVLSFVLIALWRLARPAWTITRRRAVIVGTGRAAAAILDVLRREAPHDYDVAGLVMEPGGQESALPVIGTARELLAIAQRERAAEIVLAPDGELPASVLPSLLDVYEQGVSIISMPLLYEQITGRVPVEHLSPSSWAALFPPEGETAFDFYPPVKRAMDITLALAGLVVLSALLVVIAPVLWLDSPGPLFFRQERVGQGGKPFRLIKLRTMILDAERDTGPTWATANDPRVTRTGWLLRRTRLDELPQLVNVLRGDMSLIGPRPERPEFVADLSQTIPFYRARHAVKPGITGWAQVQHPYANTPQDVLIKLEYDLYYLRHRSLALDVVILLRTAGRMLTLRGL